MRRTMHPQRAQRWMVSDLNPFLWPLKGMADMARATRMPRSDDGPTAMMEHWTAAMTSASWDLYRDLRDAEWLPVADSARGEVRFELPEPTQGYAAIVGEAGFGAGRRAFAFSTSLAVAAAAGEPPYGTQPLGRDGLCAELASSDVVRVP